MIHTHMYAYNLMFICFESKDFPSLKSYFSQINRCCQLLPHVRCCQSGSTPAIPDTVSYPNIINPFANIIQHFVVLLNTFWLRALTNYTRYTSRKGRQFLHTPHPSLFHTYMNIAFDAITAILKREISF